MSDQQIIVDPFHRALGAPANTELPIVERILHDHLPHCSAWIFGSRATGSGRPHSDLDLAIDNGAPLTLRARFDLQRALLDAPIPFLVDLVDLREADASFREAIRPGMFRIMG